MKNIILNVPDDRAEEFVTKLAALMKDCGASVGETQETREEYNPEEGEFVTAENGESKATAIFIKFVEDGSVFTAYACLDAQGKLHMRNDDIPWEAQGLRPATDEEKERLEKELAKVGKEWNPYDCEFEDCETYKAIRTFEDACSSLNERIEKGDKLALSLMNDLQFNSPRTPDLLAFIKLRIIAYAINGGWTPKFEKNEYRFYPWFYFYTQQEIDSMSEEDKKGIRVLGRSNDSANAKAGVGYADTDNASSSSYTRFGGRLCFFDKERAKYAGNQFLDIYCDIIIPEYVEEMQ